MNQPAKTKDQPCFMPLCGFCENEKEAKKDKCRKCDQQNLYAKIKICDKKS